MVGENSDTQGALISGIKARWYDVAQYFDGAYLIYSCVIKLVRLQSGNKVLDIGCGTGTVLLRLRRQYGNSVSLYGIDPSRDMIEIAVKKSKKRGADIEFIITAGERLPFEDGTFDIVISSLAFHHMPQGTKTKVIEEAWRVLKPNGRLVISDFGKPHGLFSKLIAGLIGRFDFASYSFLVENFRGAIPEILRASKFKSVEIAGVQFGFIEHIVTLK